VQPAPPPAVPFLLAVSDRRLLPGGTSLPAWAAAVAEAGVPALQLREKDLADRALWALAFACRERMAAACRLLVNGRADLALAAGADGVHLPADEVPAAPLRRWLGGRFLVGRSTHRLEEVAAAAAEGVDYVTFGPVFATPAKSVFGPPQGLDALAAACRQGVPVIAVGGLTWERLPLVAAAGARGAAGIRCFHEPGLAAGVARARSELAA
jgi:thiamine-phosphate pyrophosphorylase